MDDKELFMELTQKSDLTKIYIETIISNIKKAKTELEKAEKEAQKTITVSAIGSSIPEMNGVNIVKAALAQENKIIAKRNFEIDKSNAKIALKKLDFYIEYIN